MIDLGQISFEPPNLNQFEQAFCLILLHPIVKACANYAWKICMHFATGIETLHKNESMVGYSETTLSKRMGKGAKFKGRVVRSCHNKFTVLLA